jgi:hypothetical protein
MEPVVFFIVPSNLHFNFFLNFVPYNLNLKKYPKNIPKNYVNILKIGDKFNYENKLHWPITIIRMLTTSILKARTKRQLFVKTIHVFSNTWILIVNCLQKKRSNSLPCKDFQKIRISIQLWKWMTTLVKKKCTQKIDIIFKFSSIFCMFYLETPIFYSGTIFWTILSCFQKKKKKKKKIPFHLSSFPSFLVYLCLFVIDEGSFYFFCLDMTMKNTKVTSILCLCSSTVA